MTCTFICLYRILWINFEENIVSWFISSMYISSAAQVSFHWRQLTERSCAVKEFRELERQNSFRYANGHCLQVVTPIPIIKGGGGCTHTNSVAASILTKRKWWHSMLSHRYPLQGRMDHPILILTPILSDPFPECFFQGSMQIRLRCSFSAGVSSLMWVKIVLSSAELSLSIAVQHVQPVQNLLYQPPTQPVLDQCICLSVISEGLETGTRNTRKNGLCWTGTGWEEKDHSVSCHHRPLPDIAGVPGRDSGLLSAGQGRAGRGLSHLPQGDDQHYHIKHQAQFRI